MGISHLLLGAIGLFGGMIIASGVIALLIGLNIIPRYAGITHTAHRMLLYENCAMAGAFVGNLFTLFHWNLNLGSWAAGAFGLFGGIFLGSWIIALTEILDIIPIMVRRVGLIRGVGGIIVCTAVGKMLWSLLYYYKRW